MPTLGAAWRLVRDRFRAAGLDTPELDARLLARAALAAGNKPFELNRDEHAPAPPDFVDRLEGLAQRRLAGEPVARILGHKEFYGRDFLLNAATLVPRPETELLVDVALQQLRGHHGGSVLDLGTGTGCVAISILAECPDARAVAVDLSPEALDCARRNAQANAVADRIELVAGNWFEPVADRTFSLIVSNPPYIETETIETLAPEVRRFDPMLALDGGADGLAAYRTIVEGGTTHLQPGGAVALEIGSTQGEAVSALLATAGYQRIEVVKDLAGLDRVVFAHHV